MTKEDIEKLVIKYLEGNCSSTEKSLLEDFLDDYQNDKHWVSSVHGVRQIREDRLYQKIKNQIAHSKTIHFKKQTRAKFRY